MVAMYREPYIKGFTTNPTLMRRQASPTTRLREEVLRPFRIGRSRSRCFPTSSPRWSARRARSRAGARRLRENAGHQHEARARVRSDRRFSPAGIKVNVTALMTLAQVGESRTRSPRAPSYVSVFAGRIADTGLDPVSADDRR